VPEEVARAALADLRGLLVSPTVSPLSFGSPDMVVGVIASIPQRGLQRGKARAANGGNAMTASLARHAPCCAYGSRRSMVAA
jgi:hypothetical protein